MDDHHGDELTPALEDPDLEAIARRVAELVEARGRAPTGPAALLSTAQVAERLNVSEDHVRDHAASLGAIKLGDHRRAPLRFEPERVDEWLEQRRLGGPERRRRRRPGPARRPEGVELLPIRGDLL